MGVARCAPFFGALQLVNVAATVNGANVLQLCILSPAGVLLPRRCVWRAVARPVVSFG